MVALVFVVVVEVAAVEVVAIVVVAIVVVAAVAGRLARLVRLVFLQACSRVVRQVRRPSHLFQDHLSCHRDHYRRHETESCCTRRTINYCNTHTQRQHIEVKTIVGKRQRHWQRTFRLAPALARPARGRALRRCRASLSRCRALRADRRSGPPASRRAPAARSIGGAQRRPGRASCQVK